MKYELWTIFEYTWICIYIYVLHTFEFKGLYRGLSVTVTKAQYLVFALSDVLSFEYIYAPEFANT